MAGEPTSPRDAADRGPAQRSVVVLSADDHVVDVLSTELGAGWRIVRVAGLRALRLAVARDRPDALLVDSAGLPGEVKRALEAVRTDFQTAGLPLLLAVPADASVERLTAFGDVVDDYVSTPWPSGAAGHRLAWMVCRNTEANALTAHTGLPGLPRARHDLATRLSAGGVFAYCVLDLDGFGVFNNLYGYEHGDRLLRVLVTAIRRAAVDLQPAPFVAHIAGDDFVLTCSADQVRPACREIADLFEADSLPLYDEATRDRRAMRVTDRRGHVRDVPLVTVSVGVATNEHRHFTSAHHVRAVAAEMLAFAKRSEGSSIGVDRRKA